MLMKVKKIFVYSNTLNNMKWRSFRSQGDAEQMEINLMFRAWYKKTQKRKNKISNLHYTKNQALLESLRNRFRINLWITQCWVKLISQQSYKRVDNNRKVSKT